MGQNIPDTNGGSSLNHPGTDISSIVVDADDVIETMRRNARDEREKRSHVLRVSPPFDGEKTATPLVTEPHTRYPPEMDPKPIHISPAGILAESTSPHDHSQLSSILAFPDRSEAFYQFREQKRREDEFELWEKLSEEERDAYRDEFEDDYWDTYVEIWEGHVRKALENAEEITITSQYTGIKDTTIKDQIKDNNAE